ncbi:type II CAAX endopeptidase family protein [Frateuria sp. Soil773]|uniref:CPBP family intramembrane glutamic endopeptidase n=1 Tax=Frateuria sp. Soil773 TaxID=1736407 RepID=UPI00138F237F|nr:type II CAAX endopeptidase family protein [Frateuria sp. Soil773]
MSWKHFFCYEEPLLPIWKRIFLRSPASRLLWFAGLLLIASGVLHVAYVLLGVAGSSGHGITFFPGFIERIVPPLLAYLALVVFIERRRINVGTFRLSLIGRSGIALLCGALLAGTIFLTILGLKGATLTGWREGVPWIETILVYGLTTSVGEEIVMRGVIFNTLDEGAGPWVAFAVSILIFCLTHLTNPHATVWSAIAFTVQHGLLAPAVYLFVRRSLTVSIAAHMGWAVVQTCLLGKYGLIAYQTRGPTWLSGGPVFGEQASIISSILCIVVAGLLLGMHSRKAACATLEDLSRQPPSGKAATPLAGPAA